MKIGNLGSDGRVVLGPMSGFTSAAYREFMKPFGVAFSISEMTSARALGLSSTSTPISSVMPTVNPSFLRIS